MGERSYLAQLRAKKRWSLQRASMQIGVSVNTLNRWELGKQVPHGYNLQQLCDVYGVSPKDLGLSVHPEKEPGVVPARPVSHIATFLASDLSMRLLTLAFTPHRNFAEVQRETSTILEEFDAMNIDPMTRREALRRLAAMSMMPFYASSSSTNPRSFGEIITQQAASIAACQELARGKDASDLALAFEGVSASLNQLEPIIKESSRYRNIASTLASQATRLQTGLVRHLEGAAQAISYSQQATLYGKTSNDISEYLTTLMSLAFTYYYAPGYEKQALQAAEQAESVLLAHKERVPLFIQGDVYGVLAIIQAKNGIPSDVALRQTEKYAFSYQEDTILEVDDRLALLIDNQAIAFSHRGEYEKAFSLWSQIIDGTTFSAKRSVMSERAHIAALNVMALSSLKTKDKDLEYSIHLWEAGIQGTRTLKSEHRFNEALITYQVMEALYGNDKRVKDLRPLVIHW